MGTTGTHQVTGPGARRGVPPTVGATLDAVRPGPVTLTMAVVLLLLTAACYLGLTWAHAQEVCAQPAAPADRTTSAATVEWSWPAGFRCTSEDGGAVAPWWGAGLPG